MSSRVDGKSSGTIAVPPGGSAAMSSPLAREHTLERADELEVGGADVRDDPESRSRDLAQLGDLSEAAHRQLEDADLGVRLEPAERERDADLVVVARLGRDRRALRARRARRGCPSSTSCPVEPVIPTTRAELRSRTARPSAASAAKGVVRDERRGGAARERVVEELGARDRPRRRGRRPRSGASRPGRR